MGQVFSKAKLVMDWLATCATVVARTGAPVSWFSPVGFPVVQPYRSDSKTTTVGCIAQLHWMLRMQLC